MPNAAEPSPRRAIFITGAGSGIGLATARRFRREGWFVGGVDRNPTAVAALSAELADDGLAAVLDVTDREAFRAALDRFAAASGGRLDVLFNNAGIGGGGPFVDMAWEEVRALVEINLVAVLSGIHLAWPLLKATPGSLCVSTSSSSAIYGMANIAVYSATKHAVKGLTEALAVEFAAHGVRAADTLPGVIDTPLIPRDLAATVPKQGPWRLIPPDAVADAIWRAYHASKLHWYVPEELHALDIAQTQDPEGRRDEMIAGGGLF